MPNNPADDKAGSGRDPRVDPKVGDVLRRLNETRTVVRLTHRAADGQVWKVTTICSLPTNEWKRHSRIKDWYCFAKHAEVLHAAPDNSITKQRLANIRAREQATTKGPWHAAGSIVRNDHDQDLCMMDQEFPWEPGCGKRPVEDLIADASFIAEARQDIPDLIAELDRLQSELALVLKGGHRAE